MPQLTATDLLEPKGELDRSALWPKVPMSTVTGNLAEYLNEGYALAASVTVDADKDEAAKQWAYHKAYKNVYKRLLARPSTVSFGQQGSSSYLLTQIEHMGELAAEALQKFEAVLGAVEEDEGESYAVITSLR